MTVQLVDLSGSDLLDRADELHERRRRTEVELLQVVAEFARQHGADTVDTVDPVATRLQLSPYAGRQLIADVLDLEHRLPQVRARLASGDARVSSCSSCRPPDPGAVPEEAAYVEVPVDAYEIPVRHRHAVHLLTPADTFPFASNTTREVQIDHTQAYDRDGPSRQSRVGNYGPMTATHHRIKAHGRWQLRQPFPGLYIWRDPHGVTYVVDHTGTRRVPSRRTSASRLEVQFSELVLAS